jgi:hypothetical protein
MRKTVQIVMIIVLELAVSSVSWVATLTPIKILGGPTNQVEPNANANYLVWAENSIAYPNTYNAFEQALPVGSHQTFQMNQVGTQGFTGAIDGESTSAIYQQVQHGNSDIKFFDLALHNRSSAPAGINTRLWEWAPSVSTGFIEFGRLNKISEA